LSKDKKDKWIQDYVDSGTAVATKRIQYSETAIIHEQEDMRQVEMAGSRTRKPEKTSEDMLNATRNSFTNLASSDDEDDGEDQEDGKDEEDDQEDTELGQLSEGDESGWVMGTSFKMV
jgi:hypothetical protein